MRVLILFKVNWMELQMKILEELEKLALLQEELKKLLEKIRNES
jgi:hypothetical protein